MAIMLVIICIAAASIMAAAYIGSRENAPQLSGNVVSGSTARTAAVTGLRMARAVFECDSADFRTALADGVLFSDVAVGEGTVTVTGTALDGSAVTPSTQYFRVKSIGACNGMKQIAEAVARIALDDVAPNPTFSDFALFGSEMLEINSGTLTRWSASPEAAWGSPVWVGTNSILSGHIALIGATHALDTIAQVDSDGGSSVVNDSSDGGNNIRIQSLAGNLGLPVLQSPPVNTSMCSPSPTPIVDITSGTTLSNDSWILTSVRVADTGVVRVNSGSLVTRLVTGNVTIENGGQLLVETAHDFVINGNLTVRNGGAIVVSPGIRCRIWVGGNLVVDDGIMGITPAAAAGMTDIQRGLPTYKNPNELQIYQIPSVSHKTWPIDNGSIVVARIYAPNADVRLDHSSCMMGCFLGKQARICGSSVLHYDPCLDNRGGYTSTDGPLYQEDGTLDTVLLASITNIGDSALATLASLGGGASPTPFVLPGSPSPRNRLVEWTVLRTGIEPVKDNAGAADPDADSGVIDEG